MTIERALGLGSTSAEIIVKPEQPTEYVLCVVKVFYGVLLIEKKRPAWQSGKWNLPGGHVEPDETPEQAAIRELSEESNLSCHGARRLGLVQGPDYRCHVVQCFVNATYPLRTKTDEPVFFVDVNDALAHENVIPNLKLIIPLADYLEGWVIEQLGELDGHEWKVVLP
jgi:8-oxo-dGTP pyrophosphatase MutT (NUDIX family)